MKTVKINVLGANGKVKPTLKPIEFTQCVMDDCKSFNWGPGKDSCYYLSQPYDCDEITLITSTYEYDVMLIKRGTNVTIMFGRWNDGVVGDACEVVHKNA